MSKKRAEEIKPKEKEQEKFESKFRTIVMIKSEVPKKVDELMTRQDEDGFDYMEKFEMGGNEIAFTFKRRIGAKT